MVRRTAMAPVSVLLGAVGLISLRSAMWLFTAPPAINEGRMAPSAQTARNPSLRLGSSSGAPVRQSSASAGLAIVGILAAGAFGIRAAAPRCQAPATSRGSRVQLAAKGGAGPKKVLVMGGTRFIGCYLVAKLRALGHQVFVLNRGKTNEGKPEKLPEMSQMEYEKMLEGVTVLVADRKEPESIKGAIAQAGKFDVVFDNNARKVTDVEPLVEGILATGGCDQFIFMSSAGVYGPTELLPLNEATPGDPNSRHREKLACESLLDSKGFNWTSIRPVYIYGPLNYNPVERYFFDRVARGRPVCIPFEGRYITQLGHCEDLADFMVKCIDNPNVRGQCYNVSGDEYVTFKGMAKACAEAAGAPDPSIVYFDAKQVEVPDGFPKAFPFRGMHFFASIEKAKRDVPNWKPKYTLVDGLRSSYQQDYVGRGFNTRQVDYRTDDMIISKFS